MIDIIPLINHIDCENEACGRCERIGQVMFDTPEIVLCLRCAVNEHFEEMTQVMVKALAMQETGMTLNGLKMLIDDDNA